MSELQKSASPIRRLVDRFGLPTVIISVFWIMLLFVALFQGISIQVLISDTIKRFGMNSILVLAMVPAIQSGTGPNFALPVGIICGLLGLVISIEMGLEGWLWLAGSIILGTIFAVIMGYGYGRLLNAVKGSEMTIATYTGFSIAALFCLVWLIVPFSSPKMVWFIGDGLRETIQLENVGGAQILNNLLGFSVGEVVIPTGMLLFFALLLFLVWMFFRTKPGIAISAGGSNPMFAKASGLNIDRSRLIANILSTVLGAIGIVVYSQCYGYAQLYNAPRYMAFPAVAAILIGGATAQRSKVSHVVIGTVLFQGLMTTAMPVANKLFPGSDLSEIMRMVIQNGIILYALTQVRGGSKR